MQGITNVQSRRIVDIREVTFVGLGLNRVVENEEFVESGCDENSLHIFLRMKFVLKSLLHTHTIHPYSFFMSAQPFFTHFKARCHLAPWTR